MKKEDEIIIFDKDNRQISCNVISKINVENKNYLIYTDGKNLYASEFKKLDDNIDLIPIKEDYVWDKLETEFKRLLKENTELINNDRL